MGARHWTRCVAIVVTGVAAWSAVPEAARADTVFTPFIGQSFATRDDAVKVTTIGASMASTVRGGFGFELDFGRTSAAVGSAAFADNSRVTMLMGNALLGFPLGRFRPYAVGASAGCGRRFSARARPRAAVASGSMRAAVFSGS